MNNLVKLLIEDILNGDSKTVAIFGGGFKPPTAGHLEVVKNALSQFPEINDFIIYVGGGIRDGITQAESLDIWNIYKDHLPYNVRIDTVSAPVKAVFDYAKNHPEEKIYWILGTREGNEQDLKDVIDRTKSVSKYPNIEVKIISTDNSTSGTKARQALKDNNKEEFLKYIPNIPEREQVWNVVSKNIVSEADPKKGTGKKPEGSGRRLYTDENPKDTVHVKFKTKEDIVDTLNKPSFKSKPHARQSQIINLIHQRVRAAYGKAKDPEVKSRLKRALDYIESRKESSKEKTKRLNKENVAPNHNGRSGRYGSGYTPYAPVKELVTDTEVICDNCGWHWPIADGGEDLYICHKCGYDNNPALKQNQEKTWDLKKGIVSLTKYMVDNGLNIKPLPKVKFISNDKENASNLLGRTAYYNPEDKSITLYTFGRHPKDILRSFSHEMIHHCQNIENRLNNINTTNTNEDGDLPELEREAYEEGNMMLRNWEDNIKAKKYLKEYKQYVLTELFEKDLPNIEKLNSYEYKAGNGDDIEALYYFKPASLDSNDWEIHWKFTENNKNESPEAWKQVTATSYKILKQFIDDKNPRYIEISGNTDKKTKIYKSKSYLEKLKNIFNNQYKIDNSNQYVVYLKKIEEICKSGIKKRMETLNESYEQSLSYWQNGDVNSKSKIERWDSIKKKIEREVLYEIYNLDPIVLDIPKFSHPRTIYENLYHTLNEITFNPDNAVETYGDLTKGKFQVGDIIYIYDISQIKNPYGDGEFYNIAFHPEGNITSIPQGGKENYIKILNTMYKVILDFVKEVEPEYIGISSLDNNKNYHMVYANLTDNKFNRIPGYFRKDVNLPFNTPESKGRFVVLKRKDV